jgi:hypothetical protein
VTVKRQASETKPIREEPGLADYLFYETKPIWLGDRQAPASETKPIREEPGLADCLFYETKPIWAWLFDYLFQGFSIVKELLPPRQ